MKHLKYARYVARHKWFVFCAGIKLGVSPLQLIFHDWQKFTPTEWFPYVETFYGDKPSAVSDAFDRAWLHHQKVGGKHHWQYWVLPKDDGTQKPLEIPEKYVREMVADWRGAGRAISGATDVRPWYETNKDKMRLHPNTRALVEKLIDARR